jgi:uncharacterized protein (DUF433 family)
MPVDRIISNPSILVGKPVVAGTRIAVEQILDHLASGWTNEQILENYPRLVGEDILACLAYASRLVHEERFYQLTAV